MSRYRILTVTVALAVKAFRYVELPDAHQLMYENKHPHGNMSVLIGAQDFGQGIS